MVFLYSTSVIFAIIAILITLLIKLITWFIYPYTYYKNNLSKNSGLVVTIHTGGSHALLKNYDLLTNTTELTDLSIVIPAYNEQDRLSSTLDATIEFLNKWAKQKPLSWEIVLVNDGSKDKTIDVIQRYCNKYYNIKGVSFSFNCGKGAAVKYGMLCSNGKSILMMDADLATDINDLPKIYEKLIQTTANEHGMSVGTRKVIEKGKVVKRSALRKLLMFGLHIILKCLCKVEISDTQCGFKIFTRKTAAVIFPAQHIDRFAFDVELCMLAQKNGIHISEQSVTWTEIPGSKVRICRDTAVMMRDILMTWLLYTLKKWKSTDNSVATK